MKWPVKFQTYKSITFNKLLKESMVMIVLLGLSGCMRRNRTPEETVRDYLNRKYQESFVIESLTRPKGNNFQANYYKGFAYREGDPLDQFRIWSDLKYKKIHDAYYVVQLLPAIRNWLQNEISKIWKKGASVEVILDPAEKSAFPKKDYGTSGYLDFFKEEDVYVYIYQALDNTDDLEDRYMQFDSRINQVVKGSISLFLVTDSGQADFFHLINEEPKARLRIGGVESVLREKMRAIKG